MDRIATIAQDLLRALADGPATLPRALPGVSRTARQANAASLERQGLIKRAGQWCGVTTWTLCRRKPRRRVYLKHWKRHAPPATLGDRLRRWTPPTRSEPSLAAAFLSTRP